MSKRDDIMQTTLELVAERGFHDSPTALIARQANAAEGTIFRHFDNKEQLLTAVFTEQIEKTKEAIGSAFSSDLGFRENFLAMGMAFRNHYLQHPKSFLYVELYINSPFGREARQKWLYSEEGWDIRRNPLIGFIELGKEKGAIKQLPNVVLLSLVYAPMAFMLKENITNKALVTDQIFENMLATCWEGIYTGSDSS